MQSFLIASIYFNMLFARRFAQIYVDQEKITNDIVSKQSV